jgi:hypothetical protein
MKFSYNWIREFVPGLTQTVLARRLHHDEDGRVRRHYRGRRRARRRPHPPQVEAVAPISDTRSVKAVVDLGELCLRTVVCGAPGAGPGC